LGVGFGGEGGQDEVDVGHGFEMMLDLSPMHAMFEGPGERKTRPGWS
jgi:hypothetical protein